eukprot:8776479-Ditylum_brightwellii.AAC.1
MAITSLLVSYRMLVFLPHRTAGRLLKEDYKRGKKMPSKKKASGRGAAYTTAENQFLVSNISTVLPILGSGWDKVHGMHIKLYGAKNRTVELVRRCFTNMHQTKAPSGDPAIAQEIREAKMAWLQTCAKSECST